MAKPVGSRCNLACGYCYYLQKPHVGERMSDETLERFIRNYIEASSEREVYFVWHGGEPALAGLGFYKKAVGLQKKYSTGRKICRNNLQTNGTLLDDEWCDFLAAEHFDVGLSVDGTEELHDRNRCGSFAKAAAAVRRLQARGIQPDLLCTVTRETARMKCDLFRTLKNFGTGWIQFIPIVGTENEVGGEEYGGLLCAVFDEWATNDLGSVNVQMFAETARVWAGGSAGLCWMAPKCGRVVVVEMDGGVYSCDHFVDEAHRLGNLNEGNLRGLVDSDFQKGFGEMKRSGLAEKCRACEFLPACNGGCPKDRDANGLNVLCAGYEKFFAHSKPFFAEMTRLAQAGADAQTIMAANRARIMAKWKGIGRNDLCPCGSGRKAKNCCWERRP